jgi:hypothetical protein
MIKESKRIKKEYLVDIKILLVLGKASKKEKKVTMTDWLLLSA